MADEVTTDESKVMCVADGTRSPSMRARTPTKLDLLARCRAPHHGPQSRRRSSFSGHEKRRAPSFPSFEAVCAFSARSRSFSLRLVSPRGALSLRLLARLLARLARHWTCSPGGGGEFGRNQQRRGGAGARHRDRSGCRWGSARIAGTRGTREYGRSGAEECATPSRSPSRSASTSCWFL